MKALTGKEFYASRTDIALRNCQNEGYKALSMPRLIDLRIQSSPDEKIWQRLYTTTSIRATGITKLGNPIVAYVHIHNYFSNHENITKAIEQGLINGAGILPKEKFYRLLNLEGVTDQEGNRLVWVVDYTKLRRSHTNIIEVKRALENPQTIPFIGSEGKAEKYLERHKEIFGDKIGIWHFDDLSHEPLARILFVGSTYYSDLDGGDFDLYGRFFGVRRSNINNAASKIKRPTLERILSVSPNPNT